MRIEAVECVVSNGDISMLVIIDGFAIRGDHSPVYLSRQEERVLGVLVRRRHGDCVPYEDFYDKMIPYRSWNKDLANRQLRVVVRRLRLKLGPLRVRINNVRDLGYTLTYEKLEDT